MTRPVKTRVQDVFRPRSAAPLVGDHARWRGLTFLGPAVGLVVFAGILGTDYQSHAVLAVGAGVALMISLIDPALALSLALSATLCGGTFASVASVGHLWIVLTAALFLFREPSRLDAEWVRTVTIPMVLVLWLASRLLVSPGTAPARALISCSAVILLVPAMRRELKPLLARLAIAGTIFIFATSYFGLYGQIGVRFAGISGNPNRMVLGLLAFAPIIAWFALQRRSWLAKIVLLVPVAMSVTLVLRSGSGQGIVGLGVLVLLAMVYLTRKVNSPLLVLSICLGVVIATWLALRVGLWASLSPDLTSLSGRDVAFSAGFRDIANSPILGSGVVHASTSVGADISTHNSIIGVTAAAGVFAGALWLAILWKAVRNSISLLRSGVLYGATGLSIVVSQLVQSIEYGPLSWAGLLIAVVGVSSRKDEVNG